MKYKRGVNNVFNNYDHNNDAYLDWGITRDYKTFGKNKLAKNNTVNVYRIFINANFNYIIISG